MTLPLLLPAEGNQRDLFVCLNSLRDVEATAPLLLDDRNMGQRGVYRPPAARPPASSDSSEVAGTEEAQP